MFVIVAHKFWRFMDIHPFLLSKRQLHEDYGERIYIFSIGTLLKCWAHVGAWMDDDDVCMVRACRTTLSLRQRALACSFSGPRYGGFVRGMYTCHTTMCGKTANSVLWRRHTIDVNAHNVYMMMILVIIAAATHTQVNRVNIVRTVIINRTTNHPVSTVSPTNEQRAWPCCLLDNKYY